MDGGSKEKKTIQDITISSPFTLVLVSSRILEDSVKCVLIFKENMSEQEKNTFLLFSMGFKLYYETSTYSNSH